MRQLQTNLVAASVSVSNCGKVVAMLIHDIPEQVWQQQVCWSQIAKRSLQCWYETAPDEVGSTE